MDGLIACPVPGCCQSFVTLSLLSRHLTAVVRRNRCGAFRGVIRFLCPWCGEPCFDVPSAQEHIHTHHRGDRGDRGDDMPNSEDNNTLECNAPPPSEDAEDAGCTPDSVRGEQPRINGVDFAAEELTHNIRNDCLEFGAPLPREDAVVNSLGDGQLGINGIDATVDELADNIQAVLILDSEYKGDDDDMNNHLEVPPPWEGSASESDEEAEVFLIDARGKEYCERILDFKLYRETLKKDPDLNTLVEIYKYCCASFATRHNYHMFRNLSFVKDRLSHLPRHLKDIKSKISAFLQQQFSGIGRSIDITDDEGKIYRTPHQSVADAFKIWLGIPSILTAIRQCNARKLPRNLVDESEYNSLIDIQTSLIDSGKYVYEVFADGTLYLENVRNAIPLFRRTVLSAYKDGIEVLVCNVGAWQDNYFTSVNSLVTQTLFSLTLMEAATGEASLTGYSTLIMMLADANATKARGDDAFWKVLIDELKLYEQGVRMLVNGEECLVICFVSALLGDTPALKSMCGLSPSVSPACYVRMPCRTCTVLMGNLRESVVDESRRGVPRTLETVLQFWRSNGERTGVPSSAWLRESMKSWGFLRISEFVRLHNQPSSSCMAVDIMHSMYLGVLGKHFIALIAVLTSGDGTKKDFTVWQRISVEFASYCRVNKVSAFCNFKSKKEFKMRMTAGSMKIFCQVSCHILKKIGLILVAAPSPAPKVVTNWEKQMNAFQYWRDHVVIARVLEQHSISTADLKLLDVLIGRLLLHFYHDFPKEFCTINVHYYVHMVDQIKKLGPPRLVSNFSREGMIQKLKPYYRNTNFRQKETSVFSRYLVDVLLALVETDFEISALPNHRRNVLPPGLVDFDVSLYDNVYQENEAGIDAELLDLSLNAFVYCNLQNTLYKINYEVLLPDSYLLVLGDVQRSVHVGKFVAVIMDSRSHIHYLAYTKPLVEEYLEEFSAYLITEATAGTLHLVKLDRIVRRCTKYCWSDRSKYIVL